MHNKILSELSRHVGYPLFWKIKGLDVKSKIEKLQASQWLSRDEIKDIQIRRLKRLIWHVYENVPYYRNIFYDLGIVPEDIKNIDAFRKLPLLSKTDIRNNFKALISNNMNIRKMRLDKTGGSTGENLAFLEDPTELSYRFANTVRGDSMAFLTPGTKYVTLWGATFDAPFFGSIGNMISRIAFRKLFLSVFNLSEGQMKKYIGYINRYKPEVIVAYASPLYHFAKYLSARRMQIAPIKSIISSAETLSEDQRELIEAVFNCKVFNRYGCREFGNIGTECSEHKGIHVFSDKFIVEILKDGCPVKESEPGEIVVTDLHKYGMPLIRYRIGDLGTPSSEGDCSCGRGLPVLKEINGRIFDVVTVTNGQYISGNFFSFLSRMVPGIDQFQVIQENLNEIMLYIVRDDSSFKSESLDVLENKIQERCGAQMKVTFKIVERIPLNKSGKHRAIISKVPINFN